MPHAEFYQGTGDQKLSREAGKARQLHGVPRARIFLSFFNSLFPSFSFFLVLFLKVKLL